MLSLDLIRSHLHMQLLPDFARYPECFVTVIIAPALAKVYYANIVQKNNLRLFRIAL